MSERWPSPPPNAQLHLRSLSNDRHGPGNSRGHYLLWPPRPRKKQDWNEAGSIAQLKLGTPSELFFRKNRLDGWKVTSEKSTAWVVKNAEKEIVAYHRNESW